ncbi:MAG: carbohydrate ABC transporter permease [Chloroflexota bacterium]|nr:MAG: carbohydrate ABC transporter permease [Chloroflexota bacterium]
MATTASITPLSKTQPVYPRRRKINWGRILAWAVLILWLLITIVPLWWIVRMAFSTLKDLLANPASLLPVNFTLDAFKRVLGLASVNEIVAQGGFPQKLNFLLYFRNTFIVTTVVVFVGLVFNSMAAYAFARLKFPGKNWLFWLYIVALIMPTILNLIPNFILIHELGLLNTLAGIIAPGFFGNAFGVFFLRQFFLSINKEVEEAAKMDGAGILRVFVSIVVPMALPSLMTMSILSYVNAWNEFQWAYFAGGQGAKEATTVMTVALAHFRAQQQSGTPDFPGMMAGTLISAIPMVVAFMFLGRKAIDSIKFSGYR